MDPFSGPLNPLFNKSIKNRAKVTTVYIFLIVLVDETTFELNILINGG